jgi:hypothetical protein
MIRRAATRILRGSGVNLRPQSVSFLVGHPLSGNNGASVVSVRAVSGGSNRYKELYRQSIEDRNAFWSAQGKELVQWIHPFSDGTGSDGTGSSEDGVLEFYSGGKLNACVNCVDRHVHAGRGEQVALIWEKDEMGESETVTYRALMYEVSRLANVLKRAGVRKGDVRARATFHRCRLRSAAVMPPLMVPPTAPPARS